MVCAGSVGRSRASARQTQIPNLGTCNLARYHRGFQGDLVTLPGVSSRQVVLSMRRSARCTRRGARTSTLDNIKFAKPAHIAPSLVVRNSSR